MVSFGDPTPSVEFQLTLPPPPPLERVILVYPLNLLTP